MNAKKAGLLALAFLVISAQSSCGTDKAQQTEEEVQEVAEAPAEEQEETQPEITPGEMQGPQLEAEEPENSEPQGDPDHHPEPPPEEEIQNGTGTEHFHLRQMLHQEVCSGELNPQER